MENTQENKEKFFAQYWGCEVMKYYDHLRPMKVDYIDFIDMKYDMFLELRPISLITDEDAKEIAIQNRFTHGENEQVFVTVGKDILDRVFNGEKYEVTMPICLPYESADYLRSKGYAIPWMGLSIGKLQEYEWIKLV